MSWKPYSTTYNVVLGKLPNLSKPLFFMCKYWLNYILQECCEGKSWVPVSQAHGSQWMLSSYSYCYRLCAVGPLREIMRRKRVTQTWDSTEKVPLFLSPLRCSSRSKRKCLLIHRSKSHPREGERLGRTQKIFRGMKLLCMPAHHSTTVTGARHYTPVRAHGTHTPRAGPHVNCELWVTTTCHCRFSDCDARLWRETILTVWPRVCGSRGVWEICTFLSILLWN